MNKQRQHTDNNLDIIYGIHAVSEVLKAKRRKVFKLMLAKDPAEKERFSDIIELATNVEVEYLSPGALEKITSSKQHQGIAVQVAPLPNLDLFDVLNATAEPRQVLILDSITDPHNLGALLRTALCAGFAAVVIPKDRSVAATSTVAKVSSGALEYMPLITVTNLTTTIKELKLQGFWVAGLDMDGDSNIYQTNMKGNFALVVGSEGRGLRPLVKAACDLIVSIPQVGPLDSLNASVAGALAIYEIYRQNNY